MSSDVEVTLAPGPTPGLAPSPAPSPTPGPTPDLAPGLAPGPAPDLAPPAWHVDARRPFPESPQDAVGVVPALPPGLNQVHLPPDDITVFAKDAGPRGVLVAPLQHLAPMAPHAAGLADPAISGDSEVPLAPGGPAPQAWFGGTRLLSPELAPEAAVAVPMLHPWLLLAYPPPEDVAVFAREASPHSAFVAPMEHLALELGTHIEAEAARVSGPQGYTFDLEVPGFGRVEGRLLVRRGRADVELYVLRSDAAQALRARLPQLQKLLDRESGGDVNLSIV